MKLHLFISNPEDFVAGKYNWCWHVAADKDEFEHANWIYMGPLELDWEQHTSLDAIRKVALDKLDKELTARRASAQQDVDRILERKSRLLMLEANYA